ncbi:MAG: uroporphyrinogen decarboxylase family protein [bacterium]
MSYERGWSALNLEMPDTIPHTEYCSHPRLVKHIVGFDPREDESAWAKFYEATNYDLLWNTNDGPTWTGRTTNMGHAVFQEGGTDFDANIRCPFKDPEEVLSFDPVAEYGLPEIDERARYFERVYREGQGRHPNLVFTGGYYKTIFSACIQAFGWEMFLASAPLDYERFDRVLEGFFEISLANFRAWARTSAPVFICHDDIVWTQGAVFHPNWYRKYIFPRYKKLWSILKDAGKIVLFCSDGNFTEFVDDIASAGADGFIFEPLTDLRYIVERYGRTKVIVGNVDVRILMFGSREDIRREVERCADLGRDCPGYFFAVGNHIPHNVPIDNVLYYFELINELGKR